MIPFDYKKRQHEFIEEIIIFVYRHLSIWRYDSERPHEKSEKKLNPNLSKFLNVHAREAGLNIIFNPEEPQEGRTTVDFSVSYGEIERYNKIITVFECKRLTDKMENDRKDEYVTGHSKITGGIQRFKIEVHGKNHEIIAMIGYVETGTFDKWQKNINMCIDTLSGKPDENGLHWSNQEYLQAIEIDKEKGTYHGKSIHRRITKPGITIHHLWVDIS